MTAVRGEAVCVDGGAPSWPVLPAWRAGVGSGRILSFSTLAVFLAILACDVGLPSAAADTAVCGSDYCAFYTPSRYTNCEIDWHRDTLKDQVFCDVGQSRSVTMDVAGIFSVCSVGGCVGNAGLGTPTLAYGQSAALGPFTCSSAMSALTCTVVSGRGFTASRSGIVAVG